MRGGDDGVRLNEAPLLGQAKRKVRNYFCFLNVLDL
jgi:hypothetical protein